MSNQSTMSADDLRKQAFELLIKAQEIDNKKPFVINHSHRYGASTYIAFFEQSPDQLQCEEILTSEFEPDMGEGIDVSELDFKSLINQPQ